MQELLSFDEGPPLSAPLRFFLTAPVFAILAGCLLLWSGPELFVSRWTPAALALTHLMTVGFMMQVMLGAMQQLLPVMAGAHMAHPLRVATVVHAGLTLGALSLVAGFLTYQAVWFAMAAVLLAVGIFGFVLAAAYALRAVPATSAVVRGLRLALVGLSVAVGLGLVLAVGLGWSLELPLVQLANVHLAWGFVAWGCAMLGAVGFVVVPMFQQTPNYPDWFVRGFAVATLAAVLLWTLAQWAGWEGGSSVLAIGMILVVASFALMTLRLQRQSKRPTFDAVQRLWRVAMWSALAACAVWLAAYFSPWVNRWAGWPLLLGGLLLFGGFMSVIVGMLYKIVPFLVWLHLQNRGAGVLMAPNIKKVLNEAHIVRQMYSHFVALVLLLLATLWPQWFVYPAGLALVLANVWLLRNLLGAVAVYRSHVAKIVALEAGLAPR